MTTHPAGSAILEDPPNPSIAEVQQETYPGPALLVAPNGPWPVTQLPARHGAAYTDTLTTAFTKSLGGPDEKRKRVLLDADGDIRVSFTGNQGSGMIVHADVNGVARLELTYIGAVYLAAVTSTVECGVLVEYWAD